MKERFLLKMPQTCFTNGIQPGLSEWVSTFSEHPIIKPDLSEITEKSKDLNGDHSVS